MRTESSEGDADGARDGKEVAANDEAAADDRIDAVNVSFRVLGLGAKQGRDNVGCAAARSSSRVTRSMGVAVVRGTASRFHGFSSSER